MIRVNLLISAQDRPAVADGPWQAGTTAAGSVAITAAALVLAGWWFWSLRAEAEELTRAQADAEAALVRLAPIVEAVRGAQGAPGPPRRSGGAHRSTARAPGRAGAAAGPVESGPPGRLVVAGAAPGAGRRRRAGAGRYAGRRIRLCRSSRSIGRVRHAGSRSSTRSAWSGPAGGRWSVSRSGCRSRRQVANDGAQVAGGALAASARGARSHARDGAGVSPAVGRTTARPPGDAARRAGSASRRGGPCSPRRQPAAGNSRPKSNGCAAASKRCAAPCRVRATRLRCCGACRGIAARSRLTMQSFTVDTTHAREAYEEWPVRLELTGGFHDLAAFLDEVSRLPRIVTIGGLAIRARSPLRRRQRRLR